MTIDSPRALRTAPPSNTTPARSRAQTAQLEEALRVLDTTARLLAAQLGHRFPVDDLKEHAHEALIDVLARFDPTRGIPFASYARLRLRGAILDGLRKQSGLPRGFTSRLSALRAGDLFVESHERPARKGPKAASADEELATILRGVATACALGWACVREHDEADESSEVAALMPDDPERSLERAQVRRALEDAFRGLDEKEAWLVRRHYLEGIDVQDAAAELGLSKSWGSRLLARGIARLGERLKEMRFEWR